MPISREVVIACFQTLEIEPFSPLDEVKRARRDLALVWHPDRFQHSDRLRLKAGERLKEINRAYSTIVDFYRKVEELERAKGKREKSEQHRRTKDERSREESERHGAESRRKKARKRRKKTWESEERSEDERYRSTSARPQQRTSHGRRNLSSFPYRTALLVTMSAIALCISVITVVQSEESTHLPKSRDASHISSLPGSEPDQIMEAEEARPNESGDSETSALNTVPRPVANSAESLPISKHAVSQRDLVQSETDRHKRQKAQEPEIYMVVEQDPELIGGLDGLQKEVEYPEFARMAGIEGRVFVQFIVDENGNVTQPTVLHSPHKLLSEETLRMIRGAKFKPGKQRGQAVKVKMSLPVTFALR